MAGDTCERFSAFEPQARAVLDELLAQAPGALLVSGSARLNAARRACARATLDGLLTLREREGPGAVQVEFDALARAWPADRLDALLAETPGLDLPALKPLLLEAREGAGREARAAAATRRDESERDALAPVGAVDTSSTDCLGRSGCDGLHCLAELVRGGADAAALLAGARTAARTCLGGGGDDGPGWRVEALSALVRDLIAFDSPPEAQEARRALEALRRPRWREVDAAVAADQPARAWTLARPFAVLDDARPAVEALQARAISAHHAHARACGERALCARLHRLVAAGAGGPDEPPLSAPPGRWERGRWACRRPLVTLPDAPPTMAVRLDATCRRPRAEQPGKDEHRTFELQQALLGHVLEGELRATCAGRLPTAPVRVLGFVDDPDVEDDGAALRQELALALPRLSADCARLHAEAAQRGCAQLATTPPSEVEQRFTEAAVVTGRWASCFEAWFLRRYGVPPPPLGR